MKTKILDLHGKEKGTMDLPEFFSSPVREDIVMKVLEAKKRKQPYSPSPVAGNQHSASGKIRHKRHVWKTHYGQGIARIPRKIMSVKGNRFNWVGAVIPSTVGGRRAHPPKILSMMNINKINKNELKIAFYSALAATIQEKYLLKKYSSLEKLDKKAPFVISLSNSEKIKVKELNSGLKSILGNDLYELSIKKKSIRSGLGKLRGRKYKSNSGALIVLGNDEKIKTKIFDTVSAEKVGVNDLAKGGLGRITIYTEKAIKDLENKFSKKSSSEDKKEKVNVKKSKPTKKVSKEKKEWY